MDKEKIEKCAEAAANWWASKIKSPSKDAGDDVLNIFGEMLLSLSDQKSDDDVIEKFFNLLKETIMKKLSNGENVMLECDYHPEGILREIYKELNIDEYQAPWKTCMMIDSDTGVIKCKEGFGSRLEYLNY